MNEQPGSGGFAGGRGLLVVVLLGWTAFTLVGGTLLLGAVFGGDDLVAIVGAFILPAIWLVGLVVLIRNRARISGE